VASRRGIVRFSIAHAGLGVNPVPQFKLNHLLAVGVYSFGVR
jgi:hypothetical protein